MSLQSYLLCPGFNDRDQSKGRVSTPPVNDRWLQTFLGSIASRWLDSPPFAVQVLIHPTEHATHLPELEPLGQQVSVSV
jgi:hypothetical protein